MKFSVLLPTRNRPELLKLAIESVRTQGHTDWEIVVSDNASETDVAEVVRTLGDPRIKARRFERLVPVTDNWNAALDMASGDYLIMLGDDDVLVPEGLSKAGGLLEEWELPDAMYAQAHQYAYPDVVPGHPQPFVQTGYNAFLDGARLPFLMDRHLAKAMAVAAMDFRILFGFNMQHFVFSRRLVERLREKGPFFQSPYPDYYAANAILLSAQSLVASPDPICLIGISPQSFGFYYINAKEADGTAFLNNVASADIAAQLKGRLVPGTNMNDSWLCAMVTLQRNFPEARARVAFARYRRLQYHAIFSSGKPGRFGVLLRTMRLWEILVYGAAAAAHGLAALLPRPHSQRLRDAISHALFSRSPRFDPHRKVVPYRDILEAARAHAR